MYYLYILKSVKDNKYYIGSTSNIEKRMEYHNKGYSKATKYRRPLKLVYCESYDTKTEALKREILIKKYKSSKYIKYLIEKV